MLFFNVVVLLKNIIESGIKSTAHITKAKENMTCLLSGYIITSTPCALCFACRR